MGRRRIRETPRSDYNFQPDAKREKKEREIKRERRRVEVARYAAKGYSLATIADILGVSPSTVADDYRAVLEEMQQQRKKLGELAFERHLNQLEALIERLQELAFSDNATDRLLGRYLQALQERAKLLDLYPKGDYRPEIEINLVYADNRGLPGRTDTEIVDGQAEPVDALPGNTGDIAADLMGMNDEEYQQLYRTEDQREKHDGAG